MKAKKKQSERTKRLRKAATPTTRGVVRAHITGLTPVISHAFSKKAQRDMLRKQRGETVKKSKKDPVSDAVECLYLMDQNMEDVLALIPDDLKELSADGYLDPLLLDFLKGVRVGVPATAYKEAMVRAGSNHGLKMVALETQMFVRPSPKHDQLIEIEYTQPPVMKCDATTIGSAMSRTKDLRFRPYFFPWKAVITVSYHMAAKGLSEDMILTLLADAGEYVGVGDWRPEKRGTSGRFQIEGIEVMK